MTVITISRQYASGGDEIAQRVGELLHYQHFDKTMITLAALEAGLSEHEVFDYSEQDYKVRTFLDRLLGRTAVVAQGRFWQENAMGIRSVQEIPLNEEMAVMLVQKAIKSAYQAGNMIIVGRGGQMVLRDMPAVLHVRVVAPMEDCIQRVKQEIKKDRAEFRADIDARREAQDLITARDAASAGYIEQFYHQNWDDPLLYHLVLNTGQLNIEQAAQVVAKLAAEF